jgi:N-acetyl-gamma-glutamyl-phosphate reductase
MCRAATIATSDIFVFGNDERAVLIARLDNLGKGASGAAVQAMNVHLGVDEALGLTGD